MKIFFHNIGSEGRTLIAFIKKFKVDEIVGEINYSHYLSIFETLKILKYE